MAQNFNIPRHRRGDTWPGFNKIGITVDGAPIDLSGCSIRMEFREDFDAPIALTLSTETSTIIIHPELSSFTVSPVTINIPPATYLYDVQVTNNITNTINTYMEGKWEIYYDITK
jgi:hypothetical protein